MLIVKGTFGTTFSLKRAFQYSNNSRKYDSLKFDQQSKLSWVSKKF